VVGNITAGGSGKTPLVIRLCKIALEMNLQPGIASTGYGRQSRETILVQAGSDPVKCGDEPVLLAARTGVTVVVAASRIDAVKKLDEMDRDIIFSDDGLQQANLYRDIEFCVVDGERGLGNGHLIPAGPLRESATRLRKVDHVVSNGPWPGRPDDVNVSVMRLEARMVCSLDDRKKIPVNDFSKYQAGNTVHAIAGIGHPGRFFRMLEDLGIKAERSTFPDHHAYKREDFNSVKAGTAVIMTEKDAVKCRTLGLQNAWYVPVDTRLPDELENTFKDELVKLVKENP
jgi:tetraacyldisaccharide 4'-kinase